MQSATPVIVLIAILVVVLLLLWAWWLRSRGANPTVWAGPQVRGVVTDRNGEALPGVTVTVYDRDVGTARQTLGTIVTDAAGGFVVTYSLAAVSAGEGTGAGGAAPDVIFALSHDGAIVSDFDVIRLPVDDIGPVSVAFAISEDDKILGLVARPDELVRIVAKELRAPRGTCEFDRLMTALKPLAHGVPLHEFDEAETRDISFAARETGFPIDQVDDIINAHRLAATGLTGADVAALYALARQLGSRDARLIAQRTIPDLATALDQAVEAVIINTLEIGSARTAAAIHAAAVRVAINTPPAGTAGSIDSTLATVLPDAADRETLLSEAANHRGSSEEFWTDYKAAHPNSPVDAIQYATQLAALTSNNVPLIEEIKKAAPSATSLRSLALAIDRSKLSELVTKAGGLPQGVAATTSAAYADEISGLLESAHPTAVVARLARSWSAANPAVVKHQVADVLERAVLRTNFDLVHDDVDNFVESNGAVLLEGMNDPDERTAAVEGVKRINRLFRVSSDPKVLEKLALSRINNGTTLRGAIDIARYSRTAFLAHFADASIDEQRSLAYVHDRSAAFADTIANVAVAQHQDFNDVAPIGAMGTLAADMMAGPADEPGGEPTPAEAPIASWSDIFGGSEMCDCDDCRSVIGPAAYLVDLFEYLDKRCSPNSTGVTPLDVLIGNPAKMIVGMRPDLAHIKLTCENTNTTIPTIDLINEILESIVSDGTDAPALPHESSPGVTGPELSAGPEHVLDNAYVKVGSAVYPISLPYDRIVATVRVYLEHAGVPRSDLIRLFAKVAGDERTAILGAEILGLYRRDYEILTFLTFDKKPLVPAIEVPDLFGYGGAAFVAGWMEEVAASRRLLAALEISFEQLVALLRTRFVGGEVPTGKPTELASRIFLTVDQLKTLREANYVVEPDSSIERALELGGLTANDIRIYIEARADRLSTTIVLDPPIGCSPDEIELRYLDAGRINTADAWLRLHRFVRLAGRLGASFSDLDVAFFAVSTGTPAFNFETLGDLAALRHLRDQLDLSWPVAASLVADINTYGAQSLYDRLFINSGLARVHSEFRRSASGSVLTDPTPMPIEKGIAGMSAAFGVPPEKLTTVASIFKLTTLNLSAVSGIHRTVVIARATGRDVVEFAAAATATGLVSLTDTTTLTPAKIAELIDKIAVTAKAGLDAKTISFLRGLTDAGDGIGRSAEQIGDVLDTLDAELKPLFDQDFRDRADETERAESGNPFKPTEIDDRRANGEQRRRVAAVADLAVSFGVDPQIMSALLADKIVKGMPKVPALLQHGGEQAVTLFAATRDAAGQTAAKRLLQAVDRLTTLTKRLGLDPTTLALAIGDTKIVSADVVTKLLDDPDDDSVSAMLDDLCRMIGLLREIGRPAALSTAISAIAKDGLSTDNAVSAIAQLLDRTTESVAAIPRDAAELADAAAQKRPVAAILALRVRMTALRRIGCEAPTALALTAEPIPGEDAARLIQGVSTSYGRATWLDVSRQLSNPIRERSRDALVAFLLQREKLRNAEELFDRYYIDVGTNAFVLTSRIRQATFAVQIFVQRCLMGFERVHNVDPEQIEVEEWKIMARQAVWAARCKAMLYPEELLNPAWRDNKTPAFKAFEAGLQEGDITLANAELAYRSYLDDLTIVASLEVCGTYLQDVFQGREALYFKSVLHVVARTRGGTSRKYFYRRLNRYQHHEEWTAWEAIGVDIQSVEPDRQEARSDVSPDLIEAGVHVLPVVFKGQLYLFWPIFMRKIDQPATEPTLKEGGKARFSRPFWEIKIAWTRKLAAGWSSKELSAALFETWWWWPEEPPGVWDAPGSGSISMTGKPNEPRYDQPRTFVLKAIDVGDRLQIAVGQRSGAWGPSWRGTFFFSNAASEMKFGYTGGKLGGDHFSVKASVANPSFMGFRASGEIRFRSTYYNPDGDLMMSPPTEVRFTTLNQAYSAMFAAPMFIDVGERAYFGQSSLGASTYDELVPPAPAKPDWGTHVQFDPDLTVAIINAKNREPRPWAVAATSFTYPMLTSVSQAAKTMAIAKPSIHLLPGVVPPTHGAAYLDPIVTVYPSLFPKYKTINVKALNVDVIPFHHPFAHTYSEMLRRDGLDGLLTPEAQRLTVEAAKGFLARAKPNPERMAAPVVEGVDFEQTSPYGNYNWELFFHTPLMLAQKLADNSQHEAAVELIRKAVYTPFATDPKDCWRFEGLRNVESVRLDTMFQYLTRPDGDPLKENVLAQIDMMRVHPFEAHRIARLRPIAYKKWVVAFDVRQHLAMGDRFFRKFTPEDVNQAVQYYMIAHREMGPPPEVITQRASMPARSYAELRPELDALGNVMFAAESKLAATAGASPGASAPASSTALMQRGSIGYFGIPKNEKLLALWDDVADRLFKIRNGMNIEGVQMQLPLFSPPIDPALLAEAAAAGLDLNSVLEQMSQPLPKQRYRVMHERAVDYANAVTRLGDMLLVAREKRDNEEVNRARAANQREMAELVIQSRERELDEAKANRDLVGHEEESARQRWYHYASLLGETPQMSLFFTPYQTAPARKLALVEADKISFESLSVIPDFAKVGAFLGGSVMGVTTMLVDETAEGVRQLSTGTVMQEEKQEFESSFSSVKATFDAAALDALAGMLGIIPNFEAAVKPLGAGAAVHLGGQFFASAASAAARNKRAGGDMHNFVASVYRKQTELILRERGWVLEMNAAALDVQQARRRVALADIQVDVGQKAVALQMKEFDHSQAIETMILEKYTGVELYDWHEKRLRQLYKECFELALGAARKAEACYTFERDGPDNPFIKVTTPADAREELVAGHDLLARLRSMDEAYISAPRTGELTRDVSLRQINPFALERIREEGRAIFDIPEVFFDIDHPGYYDRRIKSVQVTIPCVAGPYAPVTGTLTLNSSTRRLVASATAALDVKTSGASIPLSSSRADTGLFVLSMDDPQYLPFEGMGAVSNWTLSLPTKLRSFDYRSIADVIITIQYTAKRGGDNFREKVEETLTASLGTLTEDTGHNGLYQLISTRHDLPDAWYAFKAGGALTLKFSADLLPYLVKNLGPTLAEVEGLFRMKDKTSRAIAFGPPMPVPDQPGFQTVSVTTAPGDLPPLADIADITLFTHYTIPADN